MDKKTIEVMKESLEKVISGLKEIQVQLPNLMVEEPLGEFDVDFDGLKESKFSKDKKLVEEVVQEESDYFSKEEIGKMKYNELKAYASELGLKATGKKAEILERVLDKLYPDIDEEDEEIEEIEDNKEVENKEVENEDEEELEDTKYDKIAKMLEDYTEEELADLLEQVGKSPKGKRQALISKIIDAIDEGLIEFEDDDEEEETEELETEELEDEEESEERITEVRKNAVIELSKSIEKMYKNDEISDKDMKKFLEEYNEHLEGDCAECNCPNEDRLDCYTKIQSNLIDDEGVQHDFNEPYVIDNEYYCCGRALRELNSGTTSLYCEICGQEYELE